MRHLDVLIGVSVQEVGRDLELHIYSRLSLGTSDHALGYGLATGTWC